MALKALNPLMAQKVSHTFSFLNCLGDAVDDIDCGYHNGDRGHRSVLSAFFPAQE